MQNWLMRILAAAALLATIDTGVGAAQGPWRPLALVAAASVLSLAGVVLWWARPALAAAFAAMMLSLAFVVDALRAVFVDGGARLAFTGMTSADSESVVLAFAIAVASVSAIAIVRNGIARICLALVALYALVPTVLSIGRGGLDAEFDSGPLANTRGTYIASEALLPLAALMALAFTVTAIARKRSSDAAIGFMLTIMLLAGAHIGAFAAAAHGLPSIVAFEHPVNSTPPPFQASTNVTPGPAAPSTANPALATPAPALPTATGAAISDESSASAAPPDADSRALGPDVVSDGFGLNNAGLSSAGESAKTAAITAAGLFNTATSEPAAPGEQWRDLDRSIDRTSYDLDALAATLPNDPTALYQFVRDNVALDIYPGALRGPLGTWMAHAGNDVDKALLLAKLFSIKHISFTFVAGSLSDDDRNKMMAVATQSSTAPADFPAANGYPNAGKRLASFFGGVGEQADAFAGAALAKLSDARVSGPAAGTAAVAFSPRHYWLRTAGSAPVLDFDPALPDGAPGVHLGTEDPSIRLGSSLPSAEYATLAIDLRLTYDDKSLAPILHRVYRVADILFAPIRLLIAPTAGNGLDAIGQAHSFSVTTIAGDTVESTTAVPLRRGQALLSDVTLTVTSTSGGVSTSYVRSLLATGQPRADVRSRLSGLHTLLLDPGGFPGAFLLHATAASEEVLAQYNPNASGSRLPTLYPTKLLHYFAMNAVFAGRLGAESKIRLYRDAPGIAMLHTFIAPAAGGRIRRSAIFDVVQDSMTAATADRAALFHVNLARGFAACETERAIMNGGVTAATVMGRARAAGVATRVITSAQAPIPEADIAHSLAPGRIVVTTERSTVVSGQPLVAWWEIDARTGSTVGRLTGGYGADLPETALIYIQTVARVAQMVLFVGETVETIYKCAEASLVSVGCAAAVGAWGTSTALTFMGMANPAEAASFRGGALLKDILLGNAINTVGEGVVLVSEAGSEGGESGSGEGGGESGSGESGGSNPENGSNDYGNDAPPGGLSNDTSYPGGQPSDDTGTGSI